MAFGTSVSAWITAESCTFTGLPIEHGATAPRATEQNQKLVSSPIVMSPRAEKPRRPPRPKAKNDPRLVAAARELRDRWMEEINSGRYLPVCNGKYDVSRALAVGDQRSAISQSHS